MGSLKYLATYLPMNRIVVYEVTTHCCDELGALWMEVWLLLEQGWRGHLGTCRRRCGGA